MAGVWQKPAIFGGKREVVRNDNLNVNDNDSFRYYK